jgi:hypothetical protein
MSGLIKLNGHDIGALISAGAKVTRAKFGGMQRSQLATMLRAQWASKRSLKIKTEPLEYEDAIGLAKFADGDGEVWDFEDASKYESGSRGSGFSSGTYSRSVATARYGNAALAVLSGNSAVFARPLGDDFTVMGWHRDTTFNTWVHFCRRVLGGVTTDFVNAVTPPAFSLSNILTTTSNQLTIEGNNISGTPTNTLWDDVSIWDFGMPTEIIQSIATAGAAMGLARKHVLTGSVVGDETVGVYADAGMLEPVQTAGGILYYVEISIEEI